MSWNSYRARSKSRNDIDTYLNDIEPIEQEVNDLLQTLDKNKERAVQADSVYDPFAGKIPSIFHRHLIYTTNSDTKKYTTCSKKLQNVSEEKIITDFEEFKNLFPLPDENVE